MTERRINISEPVTGEAEWQAIKEPIETGWLTQGPKVAAFEKGFADFHGAQHGIATTSCTTALHLILHALEIGPGDEVLVPAFSWVASANVVLYCGATPVFVDIDLQTYNIDPTKIQAKLSPKTKAIVVVHLFGLCADMDAIRDALPSQVKIVEDAACAAGAKYKDAYAGTLGDASAFSFHPRKTITTGEGGMVLTNDPDLAEIMQKLRNHGAEISEEQRHHGPKPYLLPDFNMMGFNYRMTDLQGAVGLSQLGKLKGFINERQQAAQNYRQALAEIPWLKMPVVPDACTPAWQAFVTWVDPKTAPLPRNEIMDVLQSKGIATRPGTHAIHMLSYFTQAMQLSPADYPVAMFCNDQTMAIPLHNKMTADDYQYVIDALKAL
ncbi:DegT/DnrJ/EryC1/StrS family aminotransferase [Bowmanella denitrificans]|uniref:DegT/DnrJ/EryC1/StrS family aminotransferase n=1 Tax=Bowmanella denitrificans TaxID=366582 RepID=UPI000C9A609D|nr:DegT/DnrJ/EryC1/StrS family aminotransferase [Bowmanella denitrificans]